MKGLPLWNEEIRFEALCAFCDKKYRSKTASKALMKLSNHVMKKHGGNNGVYDIGKMDLSFKMREV